MSKQWQIRRGTTAENDSFTGAIGELTMDTQNNQIRLHDGVKQGGYIFGDTVIEFQAPTAENGYTWYRLYSSGWVEQGGQTASATQSTTHAIVLPVEMANANYFVCLTQTVKTNGYIIRATNRTTTGFNIEPDSFTGSANPSGVKLWRVSGMAA